MSPGVHRSLVTTTAALTTRVTLAGLVTVLAALRADADPSGGTVAGGSASIQGQGTGSVIINQSSQNAIINWATFNIGKGETTTFNQPGSTSTALNRVIGGQGPSFLDGTLTANGRVFIVNGDGILFGPNSRITTAGFLATTNNIRDDDFMAGRYNFNIPGTASASIVNLGRITATSGGFAALVAPGVRNSGIISAKLGTVGLAAGNAFTLDFYGDQLITLAVNDQIAAAVKDVQTGETLKSLVSNTGKLKANGGRIELTAAAARAVVDSVINNKGVIEANSIGTKNGMIVLGGATGASKGAGAPTQTVALSGKISAAGKKAGTSGGTVVVTGENIVLTGAQIDASGQAGGGKVLIGGDTGGGHPISAAASIELAKLETFVIPTATTVSVDAASAIKASATQKGNGGKVVLWSDQKTTFAGTILAQGGALGGNGGFVETSGHIVDFTGGRVDTSAPAGKTGNWLLDPTNLTIDLAAATTISSNLLTTNVLVQTNADGTTSGPGNPSVGPGDINVDADIHWTGKNTLTLSAYRNVNVGEVTISNIGTGNLILRADNSGTGIGTVRFAGQVDFSASTGTVSIYYNPTANIDCSFNCGKYQNPLDSYFNQFVTAQNTAYYMLVNSAADLQEISTNLNGTYALGKSFNAGSFEGFASGTTFNGVLDGNGGLGFISTISNLSLTGIFNDGGGDSYGMFPFIGSNGIVRNLNLANVSITAGDDLEFLGALAGQNSGKISNVTVQSGTVNGLSFTGIGAGGLVGQNLGTITGSSAKVTVTVGDALDSSDLNFAGGLVASNLGAITGSSATGNVSGGTLSFVGGLVGQNGLTNCECGPATIASSFATGAVSGSGNAQIGGLVGYNETGSTIQDSHATGNVAGTNLANGEMIGSVGGFVGNNNGTITNSFATGKVSAASSVLDNFLAGGFVGANSSAGVIQGLGQFVYATGSVTGGSNNIVGGFVGANNGHITFAYASGNVQVGSWGVAGGFMGANVGTIFQAFATGSVNGGANSTLGGFGSTNGGSLSQVFATGAATGGDGGAVGGLVAIAGNTGQIQDTFATGAANGGTGSIVAGLVAISYGVLKTSYSAGAVAGGTGSTVGGLVAQSYGTITNSYWNTETSGQSSSAGGTGMTSQQLASGLPAGFDPKVWTILPDPSFPYFPWSPIIPTVDLPPNNPSPSNPPPNPPSQPQIIDNLTGNLTLVSLPPPVNVLPYPPFPGPGPVFGPQFTGEPRLFAIPPRGETRYRKDQVLLMVDCDTPQSVLDMVAREMHLTIMASQCLMQTHVNLLQMHIDNGRPVAQVIQAMRRYQVIALAQANFIYQLMQDQVAQERVAQDLAQDPDLAGRTQEGDSAQYALGKLGVFDIHKLIKGTNIPIAVIDSQIDVKHPDLDGVFADQYDAVGGAAEKPHPHGTGMAGAIAAHRKLMGIAPAARIFAVHAFSNGPASAESTTFNILKGLDWAASKGVRVINMSFAGPSDPSMSRALKMAHDKGIVLIAAAGNAGPKSPPLFPGADPNVIAVTATDSNDKIFSGANRGRYIAVAAPGVDILVPAPDDTYQLTTGTSVSSAEVSGIVALLLERNPNLGPEDIRKILTVSAKHPGTKERDDDFGSGLVDPSKAIQDAGALKPIGQPAKR